jgi:carbonic anhydrase/acetyltransferase-like protein (isoleucine patch superfamily)
MKYKLLDPETVYVSRQGSVPRMERMYRIQALKDIPRYGVRSGQIGGYVSSSSVLSHQGDCWIGGEAKAFGHVRVINNALLTEEARAVADDGCKLLISGNAILRGNALVAQSYMPVGADEALITNDAEIYGYAKINSPGVIEGRARIYGNADLGHFCSVLNNARIGGNAKLLGETVVSHNSRIYGNALIDIKCEITGNSIICKDVEVGKGRRIHSERYPNLPETEFPNGEPERDYLHKPNKGLYAEHKSTEVFSNPENATPAGLAQYPGGMYGNLFHELKDKVDSYHNDVVNLLRYPVMSDMTNDFTRAMATAMRRAERSLVSGEESEIKEAVLAFEESLLVAESNARKIASSALTPEDRKKTETAKQLFALAVNEGAAENEKKTALQRAFKELEGVMDIPQTAVDSIIARAGLLEIEA